MTLKPDKNWEKRFSGHCKINRQNIIANLPFSNKYIEGTIKRKMLIIMATKYIRQLGIDLTRDVQVLYGKKIIKCQ